RQEEEARELAELESTLRRQEIERKKLQVIEKEAEAKIEDIDEIIETKRRSLENIEEASSSLSSDEGTDDLDEISSHQEQPVFQGSLWRISPTTDSSTECFISPSDDVSSHLSAIQRVSPLEKSVIIESLNRLEKIQSLNKGPCVIDLSSSGNLSGYSYPSWAAGSQILQHALDRCDPNDQYLVLSFSHDGYSIPKEKIIADLQKFDIVASGNLAKCVSFCEFDTNKVSLDSRVQDLLIMSGIWDGPGFVVIELPSKQFGTNSKIIKARPFR
uniref:hypothetical protein n=1 Tax=Candidatus Similichlamydia epinepheli TaxID=1903953 RepID=UPI0013003ED3